MGLLLPCLLHFITFFPISSFYQFFSLWILFLLVLYCPRLIYYVLIQFSQTENWPLYISYWTSFCSVTNWLILSNTISHCFVVSITYILNLGICCNFRALHVIGAVNNKIKAWWKCNERTNTFLTANFAPKTPGMLNWPWITSVIYWDVKPCIMPRLQRKEVKRPIQYESISYSVSRIIRLEGAETL